LGKQFENVFSPVDVAGIEMKNRILMPAMHQNMARDGFVSEGLVDFYEERAKAGPGPGMIIIGGCYTEKRGMGAPSMLSIADDKYIPGLKDLADAMHRHDTPVAAQLYHAGRYAYKVIIGEQSVSASSVPSRLTRETPRELTEDEILEIEGNFGRAAARAREAGFDAVELICCSGYLVNQFLSPLTNKRIDRYGGDIQGRMTFLREAIAAIKDATGGDFPLICRLSGSDFVEGSHTLDETVIVAAEMERCGVDMISVTGGWHETRIPQIPMNVPRGAFIYLAEGIRAAVERIPVAGCNRVNDVVLAEQLLAEGRVDIVAMGRAFIADPGILRKASEGRTENTRTCIACNQGCFDHVFMLKPVSCTVNPRVNRERATELVPVEEKRKVLVVGGGPAGMEAAWVAAFRGHEVTLCEETDRLGGQGNLASVPPGREEWGEMVRYLKGQLDRHGVRVMLDTAVTPALVKELGPDCLVLATGAEQITPRIEGIDSEGVVYAWDVLDGSAEVGDTVVVVGGGAVGVETATLLAEQGKDVTVLEMLDRCGADIGYSTRWTILQDADKLGVRTVASCRVAVIDTDGIVADYEGEQTRYQADTVVIAVGSHPRRELDEALAEEGLTDSLEVHRVGDCVKPRKAFDAIHEGFDVGRRI
jgi:2,4-dienoyl-CoA reductase (NADPH2)